MGTRAKATRTSSVVPVPRYVAVCDVLGFSNLVETTSLDDVRDGYREIIANAMEASRLKGQTFWPTGRVKTRTTPRVGVAVFSDSVIVWSTSMASGATVAYPGESAVSFFYFIGQLILGGFRRTKTGLRFPIRAGIAYGPVVILPDEQIYLGAPIVYAHRMEQAQQWVGAACHPSCRQAEDFGIVFDDGPNAYHYLTDYAVPLHEERRASVVDTERPNQLPIAVAWPGMIWTLPNSPEDYYMKTVEDLLLAQTARTGPASSESKKWKNTLAFGKTFREFRDPDDKEPL